VNSEEKLNLERGRRAGYKMVTTVLVSALHYTVFT
jgi:hypothetical protein